MMILSDHIKFICSSNCRSTFIELTNVHNTEAILFKPQFNESMHWWFTELCAKMTKESISRYNASKHIQMQ